MKLFFKASDISFSLGNNAYHMRAKEYEVHGDLMELVTKLTELYTQALPKDDGFEVPAMTESNGDHPAFSM